MQDQIKSVKGWNMSTVSPAKAVFLQTAWRHLKEQNKTLLREIVISIFSCKTSLLNSYCRYERKWVLCTLNFKLEMRPKVRFSPLQFSLKYLKWWFKESQILLLGGNKLQTAFWLWSFSKSVIIKCTVSAYWAYWLTTRENSCHQFQNYRLLVWHCRPLQINLLNHKVMERLKRCRLYGCSHTPKYSN